LLSIDLRKVVVLFFHLPPEKVAKDFVSLPRLLEIALTLS